MGTLVTGEALIDLVSDSGTHFTACVGGSPLNMASAMARLGGEVCFAGAVGSDYFGRAIRQHLEWAGVAATGLQHTDLPTSLAIANRQPSGDVEYGFYLHHTSIEAFCWDRVALDGVDHLHLGSYPCCSVQHADQALTKVSALAPEIVVSMDLNVRLQLTPQASRVADCVSALIEHIDLVKASAEDLSLLFPGKSVSHLAAQWLEQHCKAVVVTHGSDGMELFTRGNSASFRAREVAQVVDTVGCGDCCMAGLLFGLWQRGLLYQLADTHLGIDDYTEAMTMAINLAAWNCTHQGAGAPTMAEFSHWLASQA